MVQKFCDDQESVEDEGQMRCPHTNRTEDNEKARTSLQAELIDFVEARYSTSF